VPPLGIEKDKIDRKRIFDKDYKKLPQRIKQKVERAIRDLVLPDERFPAWRDLKKRNLWQIRIDRGYRMTFKVEDGQRSSILCHRFGVCSAG